MFTDFFFTTPYINIEEVNLPQNNTYCIVYDMSGQGRYRSSWSFFYPEVDGIIFVVDCNDTQRLPIVAEVLEEMARHPNLQGRKIPFIICGNKKDLND